MDKYETNKDKHISQDKMLALLRNRINTRHTEADTDKALGRHAEAKKKLHQLETLNALHAAILSCSLDIYISKEKEL